MERMRVESCANSLRKRRAHPHAARHDISSMLLRTLLVSCLPAAFAQNCISLKDSTVCPAFGDSSISTNANVTGLFPFLSTVTDVSSFDSGLISYISGDFASVKYKTLLGCSNFQAGNTTDFYARYTASVLCNAIVQNSISPCSLSGDATRPLCAQSCAEYAESEEEVTASNICGTASAQALSQIRADFTNCALPANSLTQSCILAVENQPNNCGFSTNLGGLCSYCAASSPNSTDSCCVFSDSTTRCKDVTLPIIASSALQPITTTAFVTTTATPSIFASPTASARSLSGGQIAGVVIGSIFGALLLLGVVILGCLLVRRRRDRQPQTSVFNQPSTSRHQPSMSFNDGSVDGDRAGLAVVPGARVARMSALEHSDGSDRRGLGALGMRGAFLDEEDSPRSGDLLSAPKRSGSLSSGSQFAAAGNRGMTETTPSSNEYTSPESRGQSEQLAFFKDYYSQDMIHPGDLVSTLWAYEPRAADEFHLERGDMIKVMGIWDDGWATGVRIRQKADDWRPESKIQRDSGMSTADGSSLPPQTADGEESSEVKAFPLVCVCLPQHWRKTIEGETTDTSGPTQDPDLP